MTQKYSQELIDEIYQQAAIDILFFSFISGYAVEDEKYFIPKYDNMIFEETLKLASFLMATGDFQVGRMTRLNNDKVVFIPYDDGIDGFVSDARHYMQTEGLRCDALLWELTLRDATLKL